MPWRDGLLLLSVVVIALRLFLIYLNRICIRKRRQLVKSRIVILILLILWLLTLGLYMEARAVLKKMNGQTFGIPDGWHLEVREDTGETLIVQDAPMEMKYSN